MAAKSPRREPPAARKAPGKDPAKTPPLAPVPACTCQAYDYTCLKFAGDRAACTPEGLSIRILEENVLNINKVAALLHVLPDTLSVPQMSFTMALIAAAGTKMQDAIKANEQSLKAGQIVETPGFNLKCAKVLHGACRVWKFGENDAAEQSLRAVYRSALQKADEMKATSLACPPIGTGSIGFDFCVSAKILFEETIKFSASHKDTALKTVLFAIQAQSEEKRMQIYEEFLNMMTSLVTKKQLSPQTQQLQLTQQLPPSQQTQQLSQTTTKTTTRPK